MRRVVSSRSAQKRAWFRSTSLTKSNSGFINLVSIFLIVLLTCSAYWLSANRQWVIDQITVFQFHPSSAISSLVAKSGLNDHGKFVFYASQPKLDGTQSFNKECNLKETTTAILGCYTNSRIYIYDVTETELDGVREVTAAHETLHAVYDRLGSDEKAKVNKMVEAEYERIKADADIVDAMAYYSKNEPNEKDNELHSIIATQISDLPTDLENYYKKYFSDRKKVVVLYSKYIGVFKRISNQAKTIAAEMDSIVKDVASRRAQYDIDANQLNADIESFNTRANSGNFTSSYEFYAERSSLLRRSNALEAERDSINNEISHYNDLLNEYNSLAAQSKKLYNSMDSKLAPVSTVSS